jgi:uncharacterized membrane protein
MWQGYAVVAMACFASMQLLFTQLTRRGIATPTMLLFVFAFGASFYLLHVLLTGTSVAVTTPAVLLLVLAASFSYVGNLCAVRALAAAPNPGYAVAIVGLQAAVVTLTSVLLLGSTLSWIKGLGVFLCCAGVALLVS